LKDSYKDKFDHPLNVAYSKNQRR